MTVDRGQSSSRLLGGEFADAPASLQQQEIWSSGVLNAADSVDLIVFKVHFNSNVDQAKVERALVHTVGALPGLRTTFVPRHGKLTQRVYNSASGYLLNEGVRPQAQPTETECISFVTDIDIRAVRTPLFGFAFRRLPCGALSLYCAFHHAICDGEGVNVFARSLASAYVGESLDWQSPAEHLAALNRLQPSKEEIKRAGGHFDAVMHSSLPLKFERCAAPSWQETVEVPSDVLKAAFSIARAERTMPLTVFATAASSALANLVMSPVAFSIATPFANRSHSASRGLMASLSNIGFISTYPARPDYSFAALRALKESVWSALAHERVPFVTALAATGLPTMRERPFDVLVRVSSAKPVFHLGRAKGAFHALNKPRLKHPLELDWSVARESASLTVKSRIDAPPSASLVLDSLVRLVSAGDYVRSPFSVAAPAPSRPPTLLGRIVAHIETTGDHIAVEEVGGERISYTEFGVRLKAVEDYLRSRGISEGSLVAVFLSHDARLPIALVALLSIGAVFVPCDERLHGGRLSDSLASLGVSFVLEDANSPGDGVAGIALSDFRAQSDSRSSIINIEGGYVVLTSGTSGSPKAVLVSQTSLNKYLSGLESEVPELAGRVLVAAPVAFDFSYSCLFGALFSGGECVMLDPLMLKKWRGRISDALDVVKLTPSQLEFGYVDGLRLSPAHVLISGGEALPMTLGQQLIGRHSKVVNHYGPTEGVVGALTYRLSPDSKVGQSVTVPIGYPLSGVAAYLLDERLCAVPPGGLGELYLAGGRMAEGYLGDAVLTACTFVPDVVRNDGSRMYRTGDICKLDDHGRFVFVGRSGREAKVGGFRVNLHDVEAELRNLHGVHYASVYVNAGALFADVHGSGITERDLRRSLRERLPSGAIPQIALSGPPSLRRSGKAPVVRNETRSRRDSLAETIGSLWAPMLALPAEGDVKAVDVFALGATSLQVAEVIIRIEECFDVRVSPSEFFECDTIGRQADLVLRLM